MRIATLGLFDLWPLHQLFVAAVASDFNYFPPGYQQQVLRQNNIWRLGLALLRSDRLVMGAKHRGKLVAYLIGSHPKQGPAQIYWFFVAPEQRGSGVGGRLLAAGLEQLRRRGAGQVALATHLHQDYYAKRGFKLRQREEQFPGVMMDIMSLDLTNAPT